MRLQEVPTPFPDAVQKVLNQRETQELAQHGYPNDDLVSPIRLIGTVLVLLLIILVRSGAFRMSQTREISQTAHLEKNRIPHQETNRERSPNGDSDSALEENPGANLRHFL